MGKILMKFSVMFILAIFLCLAAGFSSQAAVINDLVKAPTAYILAGKGEVSGLISSGQIRIRGVYMVDPRIELGGFIGKKQNGTFNDIEVGLLAKASLLEEESPNPAIAAGVKGRDLYLVMSKGLGYDVRGHLGIGNGEMGGLFIGINKLVNPISVEITEGDAAQQEKSPSMPAFNLMVEYMAGNINLGVRANLENDIYLDLGLEKLTNLRAALTLVF